MGRYREVIILILVGTGLMHANPDMSGLDASGAGKKRMKDEL
jgi:hypothetical protein